MTISPSTPSSSAAGAHQRHSAPEAEEIGPEVFETVARVLKAHSGFALECYKDKCIKRRIAIRIRATQAGCGERYAQLLQESPDEAAHLLRVLTIHVSHFFRNPSTFEKLSRDILPDLLSRRADGESVRFWSVGCASGEEPYSLALIVKQRFPADLARLRLSIVGTDVDAGTLESARAAHYAPERLSEISDELLQRWFVPCGRTYLLSKEIRDLVDFALGDLNDPDSFLESDLILCRNVLIYFERARQERILLRCAERLGAGGILVLGKSETLVGEARRRFQTVCPVERIYRVA